MPRFLTSMFSPAEDPHLPVSARVTSLEIDLLDVRRQIDSMHGTLRKLGGKVYRGVPLGDTVEADEPEGNGKVPETAEPAPMVTEKAELYRRAAQLRGR